MKLTIDLTSTLLDIPLEPPSADAITVYIDQFLSLRYNKLLNRRLLSTANGITKTMAAWNAVARYSPFKGSKDVMLVSVGEGISPTVSAAFALWTKWDCFSIDPRLNTRWLNNKAIGIGNLHGMRERAEAITYVYAHNLVLLSVNSHVDLNAIYHKVDAEKVMVVAIPCHVQQVIAGNEPDYTYVDYGIASGRNEVLVWTK
jgi:hypothetical protein